MSETLDHELRESGVRVTLVEPSFTRTKLDVNSTQTAEKIAFYEDARGQTLGAILKKVGTAPWTWRVGRERIFCLLSESVP
ncbi:hypothetical protein [Enterobacter sp. C4G1]|uniref:hypothetical protein n=1 Tax=Enterobacter sp. C4G1 TaxID=3458724 RepID=UPI0040693189